MGVRGNEMSEPNLTDYLALVLQSSGARLSAARYKGSSHAAAAATRAWSLELSAAHPAGCCCAATVFRSLHAASYNFSSFMWSGRPSGPIARTLASAGASGAQRSRTSSSRSTSGARQRVTPTMSYRASRDCASVNWPLCRVSAERSG